MSTYLGNSALSAAVKERVTSTFDQILALYRQGRTDEALAGCNLILQMDPMFDPARKLLEKVRNPNAPIDVDTLSGSASDGDALAEAKAAMAARDFERVIHLTTEILTNDLLNEEARILGDQAREKMEAAPFVEQFVKKCDQHIAAGNLDAARADLEKARALDPDHPEVHRIEGQLAGGAATAGSGFDAPSFAESAPAAAFGFEAPSFGDAPAAPSFVVDTPASSSRPAAQASDFGFTFEEEQSPAAAAPSSAFS
ncbi:MAG TPA: hypothetical protein VNL91_03745, partial [Thermoanaerobaculia bacterium]|nr:hypothetical protein [Thermoanaerobaculia bacterium]